jgi:hypothetical protein
MLNEYEYNKRVKNSSRSTHALIIAYIALILAIISIYVKI